LKDLAAKLGGMVRMANNVKVRLYSSDPAVYTDVTSYVLNISINRGKNRQLDFYDVGNAGITFKNQDRAFEPTNTSSPLYGYIKPKQRIAIVLTISAVDYYLFTGLVDGWTFNYDISGESVAVLNASDKTSLFANQYLTAQTFPSELSGARVNRILADANVQWPTGSGSVSIDPGTKVLDADTVEANTNVLDYLQSIQTSEQGQIFMAGNDVLVYEDSNNGISAIGGYPTFADDSSGYFYDSIDVTYSSDLLYNEVSVSPWDGSNAKVARMTDSQTAYGVYKLDAGIVLLTNSDTLTNLATYIAYKYREPEYRFNSLRINFYALTNAQQAVLYAITGLNSFANVVYTPNGTGSPVQSYVRIIGISHEVTPDTHYITFNFESLRNPHLLLDDVEFGKLNTYSLAY
jgi:hypothetical protein